jgi:hypothetical protein
MALRSTQPLTEMSTRNLPGGKRRPVRKADNFTAICEPIVYDGMHEKHAVSNASHLSVCLETEENGKHSATLGLDDQDDALALPPLVYCESPSYQRHKCANYQVVHTVTTVI